jgi:hypothetical protein
MKGSRKALRDARKKTDAAVRTAYALVTKETGQHVMPSPLLLADVLTGTTSPQAVSRCAPAVLAALEACEHVEELLAPVYTELVQGDAPWIGAAIPQIRARREAMRRRFAEVNRSRVIAAWLRDLERPDVAVPLAKDLAVYYGIDRPRFSDELASELSRNAAADEIAQLLGGEERESDSGPRASVNDVWGRWRVPGDLRPDDVYDERDDYANPTRDTVIQECGDWPQHPGWCRDESKSIDYVAPPVAIADLCAEKECLFSGSSYECGCGPCVEYRSKAERLGAAVRNRPQPWHPRSARAAPKDDTGAHPSLARELDMAVRAARSVKMRAGRWGATVRARVDVGGGRRTTQGVDN